MNLRDVMMLFGFIWLTLFLSKIWGACNDIAGIREELKQMRRDVYELTPERQEQQQRLEVELRKMGL